jgi:hypothetical protein
MRFFRLLGVAITVGLVLVLLLANPLLQNTASAQAISTNGGSIQGNIADSTGAAIPNAAITISAQATGFSRTLVTDKAGFYSIGPLIPGDYTVTIIVPGFRRETIKIVVSTGTASSGSARLTVGSQSETIDVISGLVQVNTEQVGVAGVVTSEQIDTLPINGRNILDIAQIQPGVILQSGQDFDPTKTGYSALGVNGQNGRTTRILLDGQDVSDETVGTVLFNLPEGAIGDFQLNRSTQDVSGSVTSTGQVLLSTHSGTNQIHGNLFGNFQDARAGFATVNGAEAPFQRNQYGGYAGGFILKDKLFFFGGAERIKQKDSSPVTPSDGHFAAIYAAYPQVPDPFKDTFSIGRLDYNGPWGVHYFARATYSNNASFGTEGQDPYALFENQDNVPALVGGADFPTGRFTHSVRLGYLKFINNIFAGADALGDSIYNPSRTLGFPFELIHAIYAGSGNEEAPQKTYQSSKQFRYDGTWVKGSHNIKYGGEATRFLQGGFAAFYSTFLAYISTSTTHQLAQCDSTDPIGGIDANGQCLGDPLYGYKPTEYVFGNGNGSGSERKGFGLPGGANFSWRLAAYIGDTWKVTPSLSVVGGVRWSVDTDRANQDLATPTCGQVDSSLQFTGCDSTTASTPLFDFFGPGLGLGKRTQQNWANFGPQAGFVYSPGPHKLAVRGGAGIYYESDLFNNQSNSRAQNTTAEFPSFNYGYNNYTNTSLTLPGWKNNIEGVTSAGDTCSPTPADASCIDFPTLYSYSIAKATTIMSKLDTEYKTASASTVANSSFIGDGNGLQASSAYAGPYKTPYSIQFNGGAQYQVREGILLSADFIHNATLKVPLTVDTNHVGASRFLNKTAANNAIAATLSGYGVTSINDAIAAGATIDDFANNGLDSGNAYLSGYSASAYGLTPDYGAAFAGANPSVGAGAFILPVGKSAYDALQIVVQQQKAHPLPWIVRSNGQISYNLSRVVTNSGGGSNQFFAGYSPWNNDHVNRYFGRNTQDHTNALSLAGSATFKYGATVGLVGHFFSAPPSTLSLAYVTGAGVPADVSAIYKTDLDGDGTVGDLLPGTKPGAYGHQIKGSGLAKLIDNYNSTQAGTLTPAGQALADAGLFTSTQLVSLGAVKQQLASAPTNPIKNSDLRTLDVSFRYSVPYLNRIREGLSLTPSVTIYNIANLGNFGRYYELADTTVDSDTLAAGTYLNGPNTKAVHNRTRVLRGSGNGTFDQGGPRTTEFSLKLNF